MCADSQTFLSMQAEVPSKPVVRPYRPPTAQEVCYQRIQLAQQQAAQLAVAVQKASLSLPGEKKRIAHVPNVALSAAAKQSKPAALRVTAVWSSPLFKDTISCRCFSSAKNSQENVRLSGDVWYWPGLESLLTVTSRRTFPQEIPSCSERQQTVPSLSHAAPSLQPVLFLSLPWSVFAPPSLFHLNLPRWHKQEGSTN